MSLMRVYAGTPARVVVPNPRYRRDGESDADFLRRIASQAEAADPTLTAGVNVDSTALPPDRDFRNAWRVGNGAVAIDLSAAREIHRTHLRTARAPKLADLDALYMRELERGPQGRPQDIADQKQVLRDLPQDPNIESAATASALRALWPAALLGDTPYRG